MNTNKNKHMTPDNRMSIQQGLKEGKSFREIARTIGKDCTTVSKEIRGHLVYEKTGAPYRPFNDCARRFGCPHEGSGCSVCTRKQRRKCCFCGLCTSQCPDYEKEICTKLPKPPYVCNGCPKRNECTLEKRFYDARQAQKEYEDVRSESRSGFNLTETERSRLDAVISPLVCQGQSLHHIMANNRDSVSCCEKTAYAYMNAGLFFARNIDMPRTVRFRPRKKKSVPLKVDKSCRVGRTFEDYRKYREENPSYPVVQLDSVEGIRGGAVLLTVHFTLPKLQLAFLREANDSRSVTEIFDFLYETLGDADFRRLFPVCLADNGSEFSNPSAIETAPDGSMRTRVFYCNPSAPQQKGACENNHEMIRRILPKGTDIGKFSRERIALMMDHVNSYGRPDLEDRSPYEVFEFHYGKDVLDKLGIRKIPRSEIILRPSLLN